MDRSETDRGGRAANVRCSYCRPPDRSIDRRGGRIEQCPNMHVRPLRLRRAACARIVVPGRSDARAGPRRCRPGGGRLGSFRTCCLVSRSRGASGVVDWLVAYLRWLLPGWLSASPGHGETDARAGPALVAVASWSGQRPGPAGRRPPRPKGSNVQVYNQQEARGERERERWGVPPSGPAGDGMEDTPGRSLCACACVRDREWPVTSRPAIKGEHVTARQSLPSLRLLGRRRGPPG